MWLYSYSVYGIVTSTECKYVLVPCVSVRGREYEWRYKRDNRRIGNVKSLISLSPSYLSYASSHLRDENFINRVVTRTWKISVMRPKKNSLQKQTKNKLHKKFEWRHPHAEMYIKWFDTWSNSEHKWIMLNHVQSFTTWHFVCKHIKYYKFYSSSIGSTAYIFFHSEPMFQVKACQGWIWSLQCTKR